jgi:flavin-dependent dehydrogenase
VAPVTSWDVIVVGARIAGSTLAAWLGRAGRRVLLLERARFPRHIHQQGSIGPDVARRWDALGVLPVVEALGAPRVRGQDVSTDGVLVGYDFPAGDHWRMTVRRGRLDAALAGFAASFATVERREGVAVTGLLRAGGRVVGVVTDRGEERADLVVGADGRHSLVARAVAAPAYEEVVSPWASYIADYLAPAAPRDRTTFAWTKRSHMVVGPVDEGLVTSAMGVRVEELDAFRAGLPESYHARLREDPRLAEVLAGARLVDRVGGAVGLRMHKRVPVGPGWALVGDAGYHLDPMGARGMTAGVAAATLLAEKIVAGDLPAYAAERDALLEPEWRWTLDALAVAPPTPDDVRRAHALAADPALRALEMRVLFRLADREELDRALKSALAAPGG